MDRFNAACTLGLAVEIWRAGSAEFTAADTTAPVGSTNPNRTALRYFLSTRLNVAVPTPTETYAIIAARIAHGNTPAMNEIRPLITTARKITGVQTANPMRAPSALYGGCNA